MRRTQPLVRTAGRQALTAQRRRHLVFSHLAPAPQSTASPYLTHEENRRV